MKYHNKNMKLFKLLSGFRREVHATIDISETRIAFKKTFKVFCFNFFLLSFLGFAAEQETKPTPENALCQSSFQQHIPPLDPNNLTVIRERLKTKRDIGGTVTVSIDPLSQPETVEKLRSLLRLRRKQDFFQLLGKGPFSEFFTYTLLESEVFSLEEISEMEQELSRYFEQIRQLIFQIDGRSIEVSFFFIGTEKFLSFINHGHGHELKRPYWVSITHALNGRGTWYETIYNNERQIAVAKTGETLLMSEPYRIHTLSGVPEAVLKDYLLDPDGKHELPDGKLFVPIKGAFHGSSPGERLVIVAGFE